MEFLLCAQNADACDCARELYEHRKKIYIKKLTLGKKKKKRKKKRKKERKKTCRTGVSNLRLAFQSDALPAELTLQPLFRAMGGEVYRSFMRRCAAVTSN